MIIYLRGIRKTHVLKVNPTSTINYIKSLIHIKYEGIPLRFQYLVYHGRKLDEDKTIKDCNIIPKTTIYVCTRLLNCKCCSNCNHSH